MLTSNEKLLYKKTITEVNLLVLLGMILIIASSVFFSYVAEALGVSDPYVTLGGTISIGMVLVQYMPFAIYNHRKGLSEEQFFNGIGMNWKMIIAGIFVIMGLNAITAFLTEAVEYRFQDLGFTSEVYYEEGPDIGDYFAVVLYSVIGAPFVEELIYRGFVITHLKKYGKSFVIVISGLLFGLMHGNLPQVVFAAPLGFFLAYIYLETGSLWMPVLYHLGNNLYATIFNDVLLERLPESFSWWATHDLLSFFIGISLGLAGWVYLKYAFKRKHETDWENFNPGEHMKLPELDKVSYIDNGRESEEKKNVMMPVYGPGPSEHIPGVLPRYFLHWSTWLLFLWFAFEVYLSITPS